MGRYCSGQCTRSSSASSNSCMRCGKRRPRFQAAFATLNSRIRGTYSVCPRNASVTAAAPSSPNSTAATAEASATLSGITHLANDVHRSRSALRQLPPLRAFVELVDRHRDGPTGRRLDDIEQLALERSLVLRRSIAEPFDDLVGHVLDRQADGHGNGSIIAPFWNHGRDNPLHTRRPRGATMGD